ncbi:MAG TPA: CoA pyrophosphatase [Phycisphaerae bacterium]|nr:CoA pyrophosphatase [Phycisphaerae bacterium]
MKWTTEGPLRDPAYEATGYHRGIVVRLDVQQLGRLLDAADQPAPPDGPECPPAAVFVLLAQRQQTNLLLIRRADRGDPWSDQIAFPGGHLEPGDAGALQAAYRETFEEVGISPDAITYLGELGHFQTRTTKVDLRAFVGLWDGAGPLRTDPVEVAQVIEVSLGWLLREQKRLGFAGRPEHRLGDRLAYPLGDTAIWGVTGRIIHHLLEMIGPIISLTGERA